MAEFPAVPCRPTSSLCILVLYAFKSQTGPGQRKCWKVCHFYTTAPKSFSLAFTLSHSPYIFLSRFLSLSLPISLSFPSPPYALPKVWRKTHVSGMEMDASGVYTGGRVQGAGHQGRWGESAGIQQEREGELWLACRVMSRVLFRTPPQILRASAQRL